MFTRRWPTNIIEFDKLMKYLIFFCQDRKFLPLECMILASINRGSYMSDYVLINLLNELRKIDKM